MLGVGAQDEQFPLDDDDFDPNDSYFHGFGHLGHGPPPPLEEQLPAPPNQDHLAAMGWEQWQNQDDQVQVPIDNAPGQIPLQVFLAPVPPVFELQLEPEAVEEPIHEEAPIQWGVEDILAMDDSIEEEPQMPPLMDDVEWTACFYKLLEYGSFCC